MREVKVLPLNLSVFDTKSISSCLHQKGDFGPK